VSGVALCRKSNSQPASNAGWFIPEATSSGKLPVSIHSKTPAVWNSSNILIFLHKCLDRDRAAV
jgi:hypothetical protein